MTTMNDIAAQDTAEQQQNMQILPLVICGQVDSGKDTTTGRPIFELGGPPEREVDKLKQEAERLGKSSCAPASEGNAAPTGKSSQIKTTNENT
jgi:hypothetical protein